MNISNENVAPELSVVVPLFSEESNLPSLLKAVSTALTGVLENYEFVLVDDGSLDGGWEIIRSLSNEYSNLRAIRFSRNFGKEAAISAGLEASRGRAVVIMDCDHQHPPSLITEMLSRWRGGGVDVVEAVKSKRVEEYWINRIGAKAFYALLGHENKHVFEGATDFKLLDRCVIEAMRGMGERVMFFRGMVAWLGFRVEKIFFEPPPRAEGKSQWSYIALVKFAVDAITSFTSVSLRLVSLLGVVFFVFAVILGLQTLYMKLFGGALGGFSTVIICILFTGAVIMFALGIIGEYIARIYQEVKRRPRYVVREVIDSSDS
jgi:glycosyltransferase involved in cell wall biosynthesis